MSRVRAKMLEPPRPTMRDWWESASTGRKVGLIIVGIIVLGAMFGGQDTEPAVRESPGPEPAPATTVGEPAGECTRSVVYEFSGSARTVSLTYENAGGNTEQIDSRANGATVELGDVPCGQFLYISTQNQGDRGTVECRIKVDGTTVERADSEGGFVIASCSGSVPHNE